MKDDTKTSIISSAMRILARDIKSNDGIASMACIQAADRLDELQKIIDRIKADA